MDEIKVTYPLKYCSIIKTKKSVFLCKNIVEFKSLASHMTYSTLCINTCV